MTNMIDEIKDQIIEYLPEKVKLAKVEFEGPEIVIYTKNPEINKADLCKSFEKTVSEILINNVQKALYDIVLFLCIIPS